MTRILVMLCAACFTAACIPPAKVRTFVISVDGVVIGTAKGTSVGQKVNDGRTCLSVFDSALQGAVASVCGNNIVIVEE